jgi:hypothetical protein
MSAMYQQVMQPAAVYFSQNSSYTVQRVAVWVYNSSYYLGLCTEEICLGLLVRDFRKHLKQRLWAIFVCCGTLEADNHVGNTTPIPTTSLPQQRRQHATNNGVVAVNSNIVRVINAVNNTHPRGLMVTT